MVKSSKDDSRVWRSKIGFPEEDRGLRDEATSTVGSVEASCGDTPQDTEKKTPSVDIECRTLPDAIRRRRSPMGQSLRGNQGLLQVGWNISTQSTTRSLDKHLTLTQWVRDRVDKRDPDIIDILNHLNWLVFGFLVGSSKAPTMDKRSFKDRYIPFPPNVSNGDIGGNFYRKLHSMKFSDRNK